MCHLLSYPNRLLMSHDFSYFLTLPFFSQPVFNQMTISCTVSPYPYPEHSFLTCDVLATILSQVEVKHGRISMLAILGHLITTAGNRLPGEIAYGVPFSSVKSGLAAFDGIPAAGSLQLVSTLRHYLFLCPPSFSFPPVPLLFPPIHPPPTSDVTSTSFIFFTL
jgi:Chlorophyll A-B binding protein